MQSFFRHCVSVNCRRSLSSTVKLAFEEQFSDSKFYHRLEKSPTNALHILQQVYSERTMCAAEVFANVAVLKVCLRMSNLRRPRRPTASGIIFCNCSFCAGKTAKLQNWNISNVVVYNSHVTTQNKCFH